MAEWMLASEQVPTVQQYMTSAPHTIGADQPMTLAHRLMRQHNVHHLPVVAAGRVAGVVSDGDLHLIDTLRNVDPEKVTVEQAMTPDTYCVAPDAPLADVVAALAEHKYGCAIVVQNRRVIGLLTTVEACRAFADLLHAGTATPANQQVTDR
jgi:acetoin utilization protein AcuB